MTIYARIIGNTITKQARQLPRTARRFDNQQWVYLPDADVAAQQATGWFEVTVEADTHNSATEVATLGPVELVNGLPVRRYTVRAKTQAELDAETAAAADEVERQQARDAIADLNAYLALDQPTAAQVRQAVDHLARISKRLIRDQYGES